MAFDFSKKNKTVDEKAIALKKQSEIRSKLPEIKPQVVKPTVKEKNEPIKTSKIIDKNKKTSTPYGTKGYLKTADGKEIPRVVNPVAAGLSKVATFGVSSLLPGMKEAEQQAQKQFPKSYMAGQVLGYAGPTGLATGLTKGLVKGAAKKIATETGKRVAEGAIIGTAAEATQIVKPLITKEITPTQAGTQLATGLVAGAGLDVGISILGKVLKSLPKSTISKIKSGTMLTSDEKKNIVAELGLPKGTTADDYIKQMKDLAKSDEIANIPKQREADQVEQYYKSLEKEVPTQQQIVKPLIAQEQSLVKPITPSANNLKQYTVSRVGEKGEQILNKPHGLYTSIVGEGFKTPYDGEELFRKTVTPKKPMILGETIVKHSRFGSLKEGSASSGIIALKNTTSKEEFEKLLKMKKSDLVKLLNEQFPGQNYDRYYDSYELLEVLGAKKAKQRGYDALILEDKTDPNFSEFVVLDDNLLKPVTQAVEQPTPIVKQLIEPTVSPQVKTPIIEPQGVKSVAEKMDVSKTEKMSIPLDDADGMNFRQTIKNSLMKSELPDDLKESYVSNPSLYAKSNNEDDWAKAWQKVSSDYEGSKSALRGKDALEGADDTMEYIALLHKAAKGNISEAKHLADEFAEKGTNAGKAIQAIVALQKTTPEGQLVRATQTIREVEKNIIENNPTLGKQYKAAKKEIEKAIKENAPLNEVEILAQKYKVKLKASEEKTYENLLNALAKKYKVPTLTDAEAKQIVDMMEQANKVDGREQEILFAKVEQMIADKVPASMGDKIRALRNLSLLGNIKTIGVRNPLGNLIFTGLENVSQIPSGITDNMVSNLLKTQRTTKVLPDLATQAKGFKKGIQESWEDVVNNVDTSPTRGGAELPRNRKIFEAAWLNKANNWMGDALKFGDRPFYQAAYDARFKELMDIAPNMDPDEMKKLANQFGLERTFQNSSTTSKAAGMIKKGFNLGKDFGLGDIVMPYTQTPANILEKGVQYTPLNIINILGKVAGQAAGKETIRNNQKAFVDAVGRTFTGTGAIALGYKLAKDGYISGTQKGDSSKEKAIKKQAGEQQYSVKIGDKWYSFDWAQPASIPLAVGADMYLAGEDEETLLGKLQAGAISGMDTVFNQSMMQGIARMFGGQSVSTGIVESIASAPSQFVPTLSGQVAQQKDTYKRDIDYSNIPEQIKTSAMKKIPGLREKLPETIDLFGEKTLEQGGRQGITKALSIFLSPTNISSETTDKITKDIYNLYKRTGETDVIPHKMPDGLTKEQEQEFKILFGKDVKKNLDRVMNGSFDVLTDEKKVKVIKNVIDNAYTRSKNKLGIGKK